METIKEKTENEKPRSELATASYASLEVSEIKESIIFNFLYNILLNKYIEMKISLFLMEQVLTI